VRLAPAVAIPLQPVFELLYVASEEIRSVFIGNLCAVVLSGHAEMLGDNNHIVVLSIHCHSLTSSCSHASSSSVINLLAITVEDGHSKPALLLALAERQGIILFLKFHCFYSALRFAAIHLDVIFHPILKFDLRF